VSGGSSSQDQQAVRQQSSGSESGNQQDASNELARNILAVVAVVADVVGAFFTSPATQIFLGSAIILVAAILTAPRVRSRFQVARPLLVSMYIVGAIVISVGAVQAVAEGRNTEKESLKDTCDGFRDYIVASADAATELVAAGGTTKTFDQAGERVMSMIADLKAAAIRSGSDEAQRLAEQLSNQISASRGYETVNLSKAARTMSEARKTVAEMEELCKSSGHEASAGVDLEIQPNPGDACAALYRFFDNGSSIDRSRTPEEIDHARGALSLFMYHAEYAGDSRLQKAEQAVFEALAQGPQQQILATGNAASVCRSLGFPREQQR
jgi:hypothetical protein